jgi:protein-L-isoaspartate(D-aspartate) O-methyltransferase
MDFAAARLNMVEGQLRTNKVFDEAVLDAFLMVPRERFVPSALAGAAYRDHDVPLGGGRALLEPMVLARLIELAEIDVGDKVLDIGCATGYAAAILGRLATQIIALEQDPELVRQARSRLAELGAIHVAVVEGPLERGHSAAAPYDVILIEGAIAGVPNAIVEQLAERGRLVTVLKPGTRVGQASLMTRIRGALSHRPAFDASAASLAQFQPEPSFVF